MKDIFDKFSIFDFIAILLSGICISTISLIVIYFVYGLKFSISLGIDKNILFFIISYLLGIIFQEVGAFLYNKVFFRNDKLLKRTFSLNNKNSLLSNEEKSSLYKYFQDKLNITGERAIYNYCKDYVYKNGNKLDHDRGLSLSAMSRSLSVCFMLLFFTLLGLQLFGTFNANIVYLTVFMILLPILSVVFFVRYLFFMNTRYTNILRLFYYDNIVPKV